jgi:uncharacterized protein YndB with AHSA1/START domain
VAEKGKAVYRIVIEGSQDAIFRELTDTSRPLPAIFNARMHTTGLKPGGRMQMRTGSGGHVIVDGDILEYDPPHRFSHTHRFTMMDDPVCRVTYELQPVAGGVEVTLTIEDLPLGTRTAKSMEPGGTDILANLKKVLEQGQVSFGTRAKYWMMDAMEFMLPGKTKSENWPLEGRKS